MRTVHTFTGVCKIRTESDRIGSDRIDKTRTWDCVWLTKLGPDPKINRIAINFPPKSHVIPHSVNAKPHGSYRLPSLEMNWWCLSFRSEVMTPAKQVPVNWGRYDLTVIDCSSWKWISTDVLKLTIRNVELFYYERTWPLRESGVMLQCKWRIVTVLRKAVLSDPTTFQYFEFVRWPFLEFKVFIGNVCLMHGQWIRHDSSNCTNLAVYSVINTEVFRTTSWGAGWRSGESARLPQFGSG